MLFNSFNFLIFFYSGMFGVLFDPASLSVSVFAGGKLFLLYVLESEVWAFNVYIYGNHLFVRDTDQQSG